MADRHWPAVARSISEPAWRPLERAARRLPQKPALIADDGATCTYGELWAAARRVARFLQEEANVHRGEAVAIAAPPGREHAAALYASYLVGAMVIPVHTGASRRAIVRHLRDVPVAVAFVTRTLLPRFKVALATARPRQLRRVCVIEDLWELASAHLPIETPVSIDPTSDVALLPYSSGTTGMPKGVMITHGNLSASLRQTAAVGLESDWSVVLPLRVFYLTFPRIVTLGATCVALRDFDLGKIPFLVRRYQITGLNARPAMLASLLDLSPKAMRQLSALRWIETSGAPLPAEIAHLAQGWFGCSIVQAYHLTETSGTANRTPIRAPKSGSVGPPVLGTEERVVNPTSGVVLPIGDVGEVQIRGPQVMQGYWEAPDATSEALLPDGWLRTGDLGRFDSDGYLYVVDRLKDVFRVYGLPVAPAEVEAVLMEHPAVREAAVIPVHRPLHGEVPKAFVVLQAGCEVTAAQLTEFLAQDLGRHQLPHEVQFVIDLPKSPNGKILRRTLIERESACTGIEPHRRRAEAQC